MISIFSENVKKRVILIIAVCSIAVPLFHSTFVYADSISADLEVSENTQIETGDTFQLTLQGEKSNATIIELPSNLIIEEEAHLPEEVTYDSKSNRIKIIWKEPSSKSQLIIPLLAIDEGNEDIIIKNKTTDEKMETKHIPVDIISGEEPTEKERKENEISEKTESKTTEESSLTPPEYSEQEESQANHEEIEESKTSKTTEQEEAHTNEPDTEKQSQNNSSNHSQIEKNAKQNQITHFSTRAVSNNNSRFVLNIPNTLVFEQTVIENNIITVPRANSDWPIQIIDNNPESRPWKLTAKAPALSTIDHTHSIDNALVFVNNGTTQSLTDDVLIYEGTGSGETNISWQEDEGILLQLNPQAEAVQPYVSYTTTIEWTLTDAP